MRVSGKYINVALHFQSGHKLSKISTVKIASLESHIRRNLTVTLTGIEGINANWTVTHINVNIKQSILPKFNLMVLPEDPDIDDYFSVRIYNSCIGHLQSSDIELLIEESNMDEHVNCSQVGFMTVNSSIKIVKSTFGNISHSLLIASGNVYNSNTAMFLSQNVTILMSASNSYLFVSNSNFVGTVGSIFHVDQESTLLLENCSFSYNQAKRGVLLASGKSNIHLINSNFLRGTVNLGTILVMDGTNMTLDNCSFSYNSGFFGTAVFAIKNTYITITECKFEDNNAIQGAAINAQFQAVVFIKDSVFDRNTAKFIPDYVPLTHPNNKSMNESDRYSWLRFGSVKSDQNIDATLMNAIGNNQPRGGAIAAVFDVKIIIKNTNFTENTAFKSIGGAIQVSYDVFLQIHASHFKMNAAFQGGAINGQHNVQLIVDNTELLNNIAGSHAEMPKSVDELLANGGAFSITDNSTIFVKNALFVRNSGINGGAIHIAAATNCTIQDTKFKINSGFQGGCINAENNSHLYLMDTVLQDNSAFGLLVPNHKTNGTLNSNGGTITCTINSTVVVEGCTFKRNRGLIYGGALSAGFNSNIIVMSSYFYECLSFRGGAISIQWGGNLTVQNTSFINNAGIEINSRFAPQQHKMGLYYGAVAGAILGYGGVHISVEDSDFVGNQAHFYGGALSIADNVLLHVANSMFSRNSAVQGGAIQIERFSQATIKKTLFQDNNAKGRNLPVGEVKVVGGAVTADFNAILTIYDSNFTRNSALDAAGAIYSNSNGNISIANSVFMDNWSQLGGAITCMVDVHCQIDLTYFINNSATYRSDQKFPLNPFTDFGYEQQNHENKPIRPKRQTASPYMGGAIMAVTNVTMIIERSTFHLNSAMFGACLGLMENIKLNINDTLFDANKAEMDGGAIASELYVNVIILDSRFTNNTSKQNAAVMSVRGVQQPEIRIFSSRFLENKAGGQGGIFITQDNVHITVTNSMFVENFAQDSGGIVSSIGGRVFFHGCKFQRNAASSGSVIYHSGNMISFNDEVSIFVIRNCIFDENVARSSGGVFVTHRTEIQINCCHFLRNAAGRNGGVLDGADTNIIIHSSEFKGYSI